MPRPHRIRQYEFPYSITTRCNNKEFHLQQQLAYDIFENVFRKLKTIRQKGSSTAKYEFEVHHLEAMSNHYHLIISVSQKTAIDCIMQQINSMGTRALNNALGRSGHLWGERYKSKILNTLEYLKNAITYLYQNPLKAGVCKDLLHYARSTFKFYWEANLPFWLTPDFFLEPMPPPEWK